MVDMAEMVNIVKMVKVMVKIGICSGVAKCVHEIGRNQKIKSPHFLFKWCFLCSGGLNMMILDQIIQKKTKTTTKQPKTSTHSFLFLMDRTRSFLVEDFHRPNGAKILRFGNFPETLTYLGSLENCQKSKSFSKIWLWKVSTGNPVILVTFWTGQENNPTFDT